MVDLYANTYLNWAEPRPTGLQRVWKVKYALNLRTLLPQADKVEAINQP